MICWELPSKFSGETRHFKKAAADEDTRIFRPNAQK